MAADPSSPEALQRTPLYRLHRERDARMTGFGGWEMPVQYLGISTEHVAVRQSVGMFDISHMGKFRLRGKDLHTHLQPLVPSDLSGLQPGVAKYSVFLNARGGILDDLIFYVLEADQTGIEQGLLIVNAATTAKDKAWLLHHLETEAVELEDISASKVLIALQGPDAANTLQPLVDVDLSLLKNYTHCSVRLLDTTAWLARTGYTGEDGFEIMVEAATGADLWRSLLDLGVMPCGLGARDTLRLEAAMPLYGQDIDDSTTPLEAGLGWVVSWDKGDFIGKASLMQQKQAGVPRRLVGLQMQGRHIARPGYAVLFADQPVGTVTSGSFTPTLAQPIALAYVPPELAAVGQELAVEIRGKACPATVVSRPFYRRRKSG